MTQPKLTPSQKNALIYLRRNGGRGFAANPQALRLFDALVERGLARVVERTSIDATFEIIEKVPA